MSHKPGGGPCKHVNVIRVGLYGVYCW